MLGELLIVAVAVLVLLYGRYLRHRRSFERELARRARDRERGELAGELHDVLGHELSLIALRAAALQVTSAGAAAEQAAAVRGQVEQAVVQLRQTVELLRPAGVGAGPAEPSGWDLAALAGRARDAGATIVVEGELGDVPAPVRLTVYRIVQEGLTNAAKHSPGAPVAIGLCPDGDAQVVTVTTAGDAGEDTGGWSGLARLERRVRALGGDFSVRDADGSRVTTARIPMSAAAPVETVMKARRPVASALRPLLLPSLGVFGALLAFYTWATHGAVLAQGRFGELSPGRPVAAALADLPERQAAVRLVAVHPAPAAWRCRYYTDGNFPLGWATFEICDDGAVLTRVRDLHGRPWR